MPSLGADMEDGTLVEWMITEGDTVTRGDVVAVVETQKGAIEIECFEAGLVSKLLVPVGKVVPVGAPLAVIGEGEVSDLVPQLEPAADPAEEADAPMPEPRLRTATPAPTHEPPNAAPEPISAPIPPDVPMAIIPPSSEQPRATPAARVRARDLAIDLNGLSGTGPEGVIVIGDVERVASVGEPEIPQMSPAPRDPKAEMRKAIAAAMARSKRTIPHFYLSQTIDFQPAMDHLAALNADRSPAERLLPGVLLLRAAALAAKAVPTMNGHHDGEAFQPAADVHAGLAIALRGGGLVAPAVMQADTLGLDETMAIMRDLVNRARAGRLRGSEMTAGTLTVSSLGETGAEAMGGIIFPPQVTLVGIGAPQIRPWVVGGQVVSRSVINVTLSTDHRVNDGRQASRFLAALETHLTSPEAL